MDEQPVSSEGEGGIREGKGQNRVRLRQNRVSRYFNMNVREQEVLGENLVQVVVPNAKMHRGYRARCYKPAWGPFRIRNIALPQQSPHPYVHNTPLNMLTTDAAFEYFCYRPKQIMIPTPLPVQWDRPVLRWAGVGAGKADAANVEDACRGIGCIPESIVVSPNHNTVCSMFTAESDRKRVWEFYVYNVSDVNREKDDNKELLLYIPRFPAADRRLTSVQIMCKYKKHFRRDFSNNLPNEVYYVPRIVLGKYVRNRDLLVFRSPQEAVSWHGATGAMLGWPVQYHNIRFECWVESSACSICGVYDPPKCTDPNNNNEIVCGICCADSNSTLRDRHAEGLLRGVDCPSCWLANKDEEGWLNGKCTGKCTTRTNVCKFYQKSLLNQIHNTGKPSITASGFQHFWMATAND